MAATAVREIDGREAVFSCRDAQIECFDKCLPLVVRGYARDWPALTRWTTDFLAEEGKDIRGRRMGRVPICEVGCWRGAEVLNARVSL
jgi:hypothetical protein